MGLREPAREERAGSGSIYPWPLSERMEGMKQISNCTRRRVEADGAKNEDLRLLTSAATGLLVVLMMLSGPSLFAQSNLNENKLSSKEAADGWKLLFDGKTMTGWHVSAKTGHSVASKNQSGGKWVVENGA